MGLRYEQALIQSLLREVIHMEESVTCQAILKEGKALGQAQGKTAEARRVLLLLDRSQFGEPSARVAAALDAVSDVGQLEKLAVRLCT